MELLSYGNMFYMNTDIIKDKQNKFIRGKAKDLVKHLKYTLPDLYLSYANDNIDIEDVNYIKDLYFNIIEELESINSDEVVTLCENEMMSNLFIVRKIKSWEVNVFNEKDNSMVDYIKYDTLKEALDCHSYNKQAHIYGITENDEVLNIKFAGDIILNEEQNRLLKRYEEVK